MSHPRLIIFEQRPRITPELQRQFLDEDVQIRTCTQLRDLEPLLRQSTVPVVLLDLDADTAGCLQFLGRIIGGLLQPSIICIGSSVTAELEWIVCELGALAFLVGPIPGERLATLCRRHWQSGVVR